MKKHSNKISWLFINSLSKRKYSNKIPKLDAIENKKRSYFPIVLTKNTRNRPKKDTATKSRKYNPCRGEKSAVDHLLFKKQAVVLVGLSNTATKSR